MREYEIVTDSNADLPQGYAEQECVRALQFTYLLEGKAYQCGDPAMSPKQFYDRMRAGQAPKTSAVNPIDAARLLEPIVQKGKDVLCILFSSALSGTYQHVCSAAGQIEEKWPGAKVTVIDSLCASSGQGMLVARAVNYKRQGLDLEENARRVREDIPHIAHLFTVSDLFHLYRGGRVSAASALVGSVLGIKPVLHVDDLGRLIPTGKVRGRRQSLLALVDGMERQMDKERCDCFAISHGDCLEDAQFVADQVVKRLGIENYTISYVGPVVGAHAGPGTVALFFYASQR